MKTIQVFFIAFLIVGCSSSPQERGQTDGNDYVRLRGQKVDNEQFNITAEDQKFWQEEDLTEVVQKNNNINRNMQNREAFFQDYFPSELYDAPSTTSKLSKETLDFNNIEGINLNKNYDLMMDLSLACRKKDFVKFNQLRSEGWVTYKKNAGWWNIMGICSYMQNRLRMALIFFNKSLEINPKYVPALNNIGVVFYGRGEYAKAFSLFDQAYRQSSFSVVPRLNLLAINLNFYHFEKANTLLATSKEVSADYTKGVTAYMALVQGDYFKAVEIYESMSDSELYKSEFVLGYVVALKFSGDIAMAKKVFQNLKQPYFNKQSKEYYDQVRNLL